MNQSALAAVLLGADFEQHQAPPLGPSGVEQGPQQRAAQTPAPVLGRDDQVDDVNLVLDVPCQ